MMQLQQEAMKVKKELENTIIEAEVDWLVISVNWEMRVEKVEFEDTKIIWDKAALEKAIMEAINKWMKKAQEVAAEKMKWVMSQMGMNMPAWGWLPM
jgi:DNA-binding protein YbaB